jgi:tRNA threonylcarbamoyl adenosine modification protein (Sua5/YciO/YrdC/YwlC family)
MRVWRADGDPGDDVLAAIAEILRRGGVVLLPTDTIYGLHAVAADEAAVARIAQLKGRGDDKPFVVIAADADQLRVFGAEVPSSLEEVWPAPLTAVLRRGESTVAARVPNLDWLRRLLRLTGPLVSTSANRSGDRPISSPDNLPADVAAGVDAALDAGVRAGKPSTIVDFTGAAPRLIREGDPFFTQNLRKTLRISL